MTKASETAEVEAPDVPDTAIEAEPTATLEIPVAAVETAKAAKGKPTVLDPVVAPVEATTDEVRRPRKGEAEVTYLGPSDLLESGDYRFRPGQPVIVPSEVAEELLTLPYHTFKQEA